MAITTRDGLIAALAAGPDISVYKTAITGGTAGNRVSLWRTTGAPAPGGSTPTTAETCSRLTAGALPLAAPDTGKAWYLGAVKLAYASAVAPMILDRLVQCGGLSGIVTTAQTVGGTLPTRAGDGTGVQVGLEVYTALGATGVTATISYTNQAGAAGRTGTTPIPANAPAGYLQQFTLQAGDTGVQSVQSVTLSATTGTAGNFGITLYRHVALGAVPVAGTSWVAGYAELGLPLLGADPCLQFAALLTGASSGVLLGSLTVCQG